ncbi:nuclease-related domain-containing protein, partial [Pseudomonas viridiflava]|uniref:nuclease-related domain-containing protein n=1 Tax=Pseudomonas viridiflava TaxID=33069 RepID=UPI0013CF3876
VTLDTADGTTQIDHVFISPFGIFVLETKNMSGWIFGREKQPQWTQKIYRRTYKFQNPLRQNYKHLKALEATLGVSLEHLHSVVSFVGESTFKTAMPANVTQGIG